MSGADECLPTTGPESSESEMSETPILRPRMWRTPNAYDAQQRHNEKSTLNRVRRGKTISLGGQVATPALHPSISSAEDSPVSPSPSPASDSDKTMSDGSGPSSPASFAYYDPDSSSWRTSQGSLLEEWATYSATWPRAGMTRSGTAYRLRPSVPLISVTGSSSSHIPEGTGLWPTPNASQANYDEDLETFLPRRERLKEKHTNGNGIGLPLGVAVRMWRSPNAGDRGGSLGGPEARVAKGQSVNLQDQVGGHLNPTWVEWLMGFPLGWTDLGDSAMPSSRKSRNTSGGD